MHWSDGASILWPSSDMYEPLQPLPLYMAIAHHEVLVGVGLATIVVVVGDTVAIVVLSISVLPTVSVKDAEISDLVEVVLLEGDNVMVNVSYGLCVEPFGVSNPLHVLGTYVGSSEKNAVPVVLLAGATAHEPPSSRAFRYGKPCTALHLWSPNAMLYATLTLAGIA